MASTKTRTGRLEGCTPCGDGLLLLDFSSPEGFFFGYMRRAELDAALEPSGGLAKAWGHPFEVEREPPLFIISALRPAPTDPAQE